MITLDIGGKLEALSAEFDRTSKFGLDVRLKTYSMILAMVRDGLPLDAALSELYERSKERKRPITPILRRWLQQIKSGATFSDAIRADVPTNELVLISSGERSNDLVTGIEQAIMICQSRRRMAIAVISNLTMPLILVLLFIGIIVNFSLYMAPQLAMVVPPTHWPGNGKLLYEFSVVVAGWWKPLLGLGVALGVLVIASLPRWTGVLRNRFDSYPPWSIYQNYVSATFMIALSALMKSGVPLEGALKYIKDHASGWVRSHVSIMQSRIRAGENYGTAMNSGLLDVETTDEVIIYSSVSDFHKAIMAVGSRCVERGIERIGVQAAVLRNIALILVAISVGWIYYTIFSMNTSIAKMGQQSFVAAQKR